MKLFVIKSLNKIKKVSIDELTNLIFDQPNVMQRPLVFLKKFYICRPPERVLEILGIN